MKNKIIASAIALVGLTTASNAQTADNASAEARARIVPAIEITNLRELNFGNIIRATGGEVRIDATNAGTRSVVSGGTLLAPGLTSSAEFEVSGDGAATYSISRYPILGDKLVLTNINTNATMEAELVVSAGGTGSETVTGALSGTTGTNGTQKIYVGGTLTVAADQAYGTYTASAGEESIIITVDYN